MRPFSLFLGVTCVLCSLLSASSLLRVTALDPASTVAPVFLQHIVDARDTATQWNNMFQKFTAKHPTTNEPVANRQAPPLQLCTDQDNNIYFIAGLTGRYIGRVESLATQFNAPSEPTVPVSFSAYHPDAYDSAADFPAAQASAFIRLPHKFAPHALACGSDGTLWFIDHQLGSDMDFVPEAPALSKITPDGKMKVLQETAGRMIPTYNGFSRMFADALFFDEARSQMFYALNCDFCHFPFKGRDPVTGRTIRTSAHLGALLGRYLQPGVPSAIQPPLPDSVAEQAFDSYANPQPTNSPPYNPMPRFNDQIGKYMTSGGLVEELHEWSFSDTAFWEDAFHNYPAYDKQRQLLYFGGRPDSTHGSNDKGNACTQLEWIDKDDHAKGQECVDSAPDTSKNPVLQSAIWVQSQNIAPGAENEYFDVEPVHKPVHEPMQLWRAEDDLLHELRFQALALSPEGDLYFCSRNLDVDQQVQLFYFTASQLQSRMELNQLSDLIANTFDGVQPQRVSYDLYAGLGDVPIQPQHCEFLHFDTNGVLYMTDAKHGIYAFRNLHTKTQAGVFNPLPVTVRAVGSIVPQRGVQQLI